MGNSTQTLQGLVDSVRTIADLSPVFTNTGGWAKEPACTIATDAMSELLAERFNFKFNRIKVSPFVTTSNQADYPMVSLRTLSWIESAASVDVNSTSFPQPTGPKIEVVRDLDFSAVTGGPPRKISWLQNSQLELGKWPGPAQVYTNPIGVPQTPVNPITNFQDKNGNILVLSQWGTTGASVPYASANSAPGTVVVDGTAAWMVADPTASGFRLWPTPPSSGTVWLMRVFGQAKPPIFTTLSQALDPLPDDFLQRFRTGFIAYAHRHSPDPQVRARFEQKKAEWLAELSATFAQANREPENFGFYPSRTLVGRGPGYGPTVGNPLNWRGGY